MERMISIAWARVPSSVSKDCSLLTSPFPTDVDDPLSWGIENQLLLIGTPDDAIKEIERVQKQTGGFGTFLFFGNNFAPWEATKHSYELAARYVFPHFQNSNTSRQESYDVARAGHSKLQADFKQAVDKASDAYKKSR